MADVRSMLRAERANRRITHPNASYTSDGKLLCNLCELMVKSEAAWQGHLHSTGHTLRLSRAQDAAATRGTDTAGKKRKASTLESPSADERKRVKPTDPTPESDEIPEGPSEDRGNIVDASAAIEIPPPSSSTEQAPPLAAASIDDAELVAFERELAEMEASAQNGTALTAGATISAAPITAEELAAQAREEQSSQRGQRDAEIEAEREDATRSLEDEFDEMEGLEERVRKLREKREALRKGLADGGGDSAETAVVAVVGAESAINGHGVTEQDDEEEEEEEDYDDWGFGSRA